MNNDNLLLDSLSYCNITPDDYETLKLIVLKYIEKINFNCSTSKNNAAGSIIYLFDLILKLYDISPEEDSAILDIIDKFLILPICTYKEKLNTFERTL